MTPVSPRNRAAHRAITITPTEWNQCSNPNSEIQARHEAPGILREMAKIAYPGPRALYSGITAFHPIPGTLVDNTRDGILLTVKRRTLLNRKKTERL